MQGGLLYEKKNTDVFLYQTAIYVRKKHSQSFVNFEAKQIDNNTMYISAINTAPEFENKSNQAQDSEIPEMIQHRGQESKSEIQNWI